MQITWTDENGVEWNETVESQHLKGERNGESMKKQTMGEIILLILKVIPLAMGIAVVCLSIMKQLDASAGISMLGIGLFCLALERLQTKNN